MCALPRGPVVFASDLEQEVFLQHEGKRKVREEAGARKGKSGEVPVQDKPFPQTVPDSHAGCARGPQLQAGFGA